MAGGSVTNWIEGLKAGEEQAAQRLWQRYFARLVELARARLQSTPRRAADEEDVALSAFASFCLGARAGKFAQLRDRDNLWPLLFAITANKARGLREHEAAAKRGGGRVHDQSVLDGRYGLSGPLRAGFEQIAGDEPTPEFAAQVADEYRRLLDRLGEATLRTVAVWKMEGWTNEDIAARLGCVTRTVERKLELIRDIWSGE
jgi:DNA-directed RNA polymerase specialized sigma24 family protein